MILNKAARHIPAFVSFSMGLAPLEGNEALRTLILLDGEVPDIAKAIQTSSTDIYCVGSTLLEGVQESSIVAVGQIAGAIPCETAASSVIVSLSASPGVPCVKTGSPTWFLILYSPTPVALTEGSVMNNLRRIAFEQVVFGSVGSEESMADMRILGGELQIGATYQSTDCVFTAI